MPFERKRHSWLFPKLFLLLWLLSSINTTAWAADADIQVLQDNADLLASKKTAERKQAIDNIISSDAADKAVWLEALLEGNLYRRKSDDLLLYATREGSGFSVVSVATGETIGTENKRAIVKFKINNSIRSQLSSALASVDLVSADAGVRLAAVKRLMGDDDSDLQSKLQSMLANESDKKVLQAVQTSVAINSLNSGAGAQAESSIEQLGTSLEPAALTALNRFVNGNADSELVPLASKSIAAIERRAANYGQLETLFFGLSTGSILVMCAIGLAITFGVMGVINMAHGELMMLGAYSTYFVQQLLPGLMEYSLLIALPVSFLVAGAAGVLIERLVIRHLYGRPLETLLATFGISLVLQQAVRTLVSPQNVIVENPQWMSGAWEINAVLSLTYNRLFIIVFCLLVFVTLLYLLRYSAFGLRLRAVAQNRQMARAMGIHSSRVDAMTFGLGAGVAGLAGMALSQISNVGPNLGQAYIIDSFLVVVFGGVGNLFGTLIGGMSLGVATKLMEPATGAVMAKIIMLVLIILFIQKRPRGLFPQRGRAAEG